MAFDYSSGSYSEWKRRKGEEEDEDVELYEGGEGFNYESGSYDDYKKYRSALESGKIEDPEIETPSQKAKRELKEKEKQKKEEEEGKSWLDKLADIGRGLGKKAIEYGKEAIKPSFWLGEEEEDFEEKREKRYQGEIIKPEAIEMPDAQYEAAVYGVQHELYKVGLTQKKYRDLLKRIDEFDGSDQEWRDLTREVFESGFGGSEFKEIAGDTNEEEYQKILEIASQGKPDARGKKSMKVLIERANDTANKSAEIYAEFLGLDPIETGFLRNFAEGLLKKENIPFVGTAYKIQQVIADYGIAKTLEKKLDSGEELTEEEQSYYSNLIADKVDPLIDKGKGATAGSGVAASTAMMIEFAITAGMSSSVRQGIEKKILGEVAEESTKSFVQKSGAKLLGMLGGAGARTATIGVPGVAKGTIERMTPEMELAFGDEGELILKELDNTSTEFTDAFLRSLASTYTEYAIEEIPGEIIDDTLGYTKRAVLAQFAEKKGITTAKGLTAAVAKVGGWNGLLTEILEEELQYYADANIDNTEWKNPFTTEEGQDRFIEEAVQIGLIQTGFSTAGAVEKGLSKAAGIAPEGPGLEALPLTEVEQAKADMTKGRSYDQQLDQVEAIVNRGAEAMGVEGYARLLKLRGEVDSETQTGQFDTFMEMYKKALTPEQVKSAEQMVDTVEMDNELGRGTKTFVDSVLGIIPSPREPIARPAKEAAAKYGEVKPVEEVDMETMKREARFGTYSPYSQMNNIDQLKAVIAGTKPAFLSDVRVSEKGWQKRFEKPMEPSGISAAKEISPRLLEMTKAADLPYRIIDDLLLVGKDQQSLDRLVKAFEKMDAKEEGLALGYIDVEKGKSRRVSKPVSEEPSQPDEKKKVAKKAETIGERIERKMGKKADVMTPKGVLDLSEAELNTLSTVVGNIQEGISQPKRRLFSGGQNMVEGVGYPDFISDQYRSKRVLSVVVNSFVNGTVPKKGTYAHEAYMEVINQVVGTKAEAKPKKKAAKKVTKAIPIAIPEGYTFKKEKGYVVEDTYFTGIGEPIKIGEEIDMNFAGGPADMPAPWTLEKADNYFSTVGYSNEVRITVKAANGKEMTFDTASVYSPFGKEHDKYFDRFLKGEVESSQPDGKPDEKVMELSKKYFGDQNVGVMERILTPEGQNILGKYEKGWIDITKGQGDPAGSFDHESFHRAFRLFATPEQRKRMLDTTIERYGEEYLRKKFGRPQSLAKYRIGNLYHGTNATFSKPDTRFIRSREGKDIGEGRQAYGWGIYLTDIKGVAKEYAKNAARKHTDINIPYDKVHSAFSVVETDPKSGDIVRSYSLAQFDRYDPFVESLIGEISNATNAYTGKGEDLGSKSYEWVKKKNMTKYIEAVREDTKERLTDKVELLDDWLLGNRDTIKADTAEVGKWKKDLKGLSKELKKAEADLVGFQNQRDSLKLGSPKDVRERINVQVENAKGFMSQTKRKISQAKAKVEELERAIAVEKDWTKQWTQQRTDLLAALKYADQVQIILNSDINPFEAVRKEMANRNLYRFSIDPGEISQEDVLVYNSVNSKWLNSRLRRQQKRIKRDLKSEFGVDIEKLDSSQAAIGSYVGARAKAAQDAYRHLMKRDFADTTHTISIYRSLEVLFEELSRTDMASKLDKYVQTRKDGVRHADADMITSLWLLDKGFVGHKYPTGSTRRGQRGRYRFNYVVYSGDVLKVESHAKYRGMDMQGASLYDLAEEQLAEDFVNYAKNARMAKSLDSETKKFFDQLLEFLRKLLEGSDEIQAFYKSLESGEFAARRAEIEETERLEKEADTLSEEEVLIDQDKDELLGLAGEIFTAPETSGTFFLPRNSRTKELTDSIMPVTNPEGLRVRIEQLNKFAQSQGILRKAGGVTSRKAAGQFVPPGESKARRFVAPEGEVRMKADYIANPEQYMGVLAHELGHGQEYAVTGTVGKKMYEMFGKDLSENTKDTIHSELVAITKELEGVDNYNKRHKYFSKPEELFARFIEKMIVSPGNLTEIAPTATELYEKQMIAHPIIAEFMDAAREEIDKNAPTKWIAPDMHETYKKYLGTHVGNIAWNEEVNHRAMQMRGKKSIENLLKKKFKDVTKGKSKQEQEEIQTQLFRAAEAIKVTKGGVPEFGTRDFAIARNKEEEAGLKETGWEFVREMEQDGETVQQYARARYTPEQAKEIFKSLSPEGQKLVKEFTAARQEAKDFFNREAIKDVYKVNGEIEGWVHHMFEEAPPTGKRLQFRKKKAAARKRRTGKEGYVEDFQKAMTKALVDLESERVFNEFIQKQFARVSKPIPEGAKPDEGWIEVQGNLGRGVGVQGDLQKTVIVDKETGKKFVPKSIRYQMPRDIYKRYRLWIETIDEMSKTAKVFDAVNRYWRINVLAHPGTAMTNFFSGGIQYSTKVLNDFYTELLTGRVKFEQTRKNVLAMFRVLTPKGWEQAPDWVYGGHHSNFYGQFMADKDVLYRGVDSYADVALAFFGGIETYWKKVVSTAHDIQTVQGLEDMSPDGLRELNRMERDLIAQINNEVDLYAYDYDNVPTAIDDWSDKAITSAIKPFIKYPYKYFKHVSGMVHKGFDRSLPWQERAASLLAVGTIMALYAAFKYSRDDERETPEGSELTPARMSPRGRLFIGKDEDGQEMFLRTAKYPFLNIVDAADNLLKGNHEAVVDQVTDQLGSIGMVGNLGLIMLGYESKYDKYTPREIQIGNELSTLVPGFRVLNDVSRALDPFKRKQETFSQTFTKLIPTTNEDLQGKFHGSKRSQRVPLEGDIEPAPGETKTRTTTDVILKNYWEDILAGALLGTYITRIDPDQAKAFQIREENKEADRKEEQEELEEKVQNQKLDTSKLKTLEKARKSMREEEWKESVLRLQREGVIDDKIVGELDLYQ